MKFTEAQRQAIDAPPGTLLVSAGAGSGKTSVLTERIIKKISGAPDYCDVTQFLVVTFTRASATDLKNKISGAINKKLAENIGSAHLKRQQILLSRANISTIHSFCYDLAKANFEKLGLPAKFRMADANEMSIIKRDILDDLLEKYYAEDSGVYTGVYTGGFTRADFLSSVENFIGSKDDENIYGVILRIHDKVTSRIDGPAFFDAQIEVMREVIVHTGAFFAAKFGQSIKALLDENISRCLYELKKMTAAISAVKFSVLDKKYSGAFEGSRAFFTRLAEILDVGSLCSYDDAYNLCANYEPAKVGSHRLDKDDAESVELKEILDKKNKAVRDLISYIQKLFSHDFKDIVRFAVSYETSLAVLKELTYQFDRALTDEKTRLKTFEFSDLERFAVKLLVERIGEDGAVYPTELARQTKESYKEIYIDEYQDTNRIQDIIFRAVATDGEGAGNRFMVGDIKQSIYAFRGAKPDIFAGYSKLFEEYTGEKMPCKVYLKKNFRSSGGVIDFINHVFSNLFSEKLGGVEYAGGEVLEAGRDDFPPGVDVKFALVEKSREENLPDEDDDGESEDTDRENGEILASAEAEYVALTIKDMLDGGVLKSGEKILPRHITVLMRSYTKSGLYADALKKYGIACYTDRAKGFLSSAEILLVVSLLKTIDNPMRDIDLAAVLKSPVFMFSLDELIYVKKYGAATQPARPYMDPLYRYVREYAETGEISELRKKCADFIARLNIWRAKSRVLPVDRFIWYLYRQTDIMAKISLEAFASERKANLMLLYEYARKFEETTFRGLYGFLNYLADVERGKDDFEKAKVVPENSDSVKIMSVHKAKGLEFPVCILANTGSPFNKGDYQGNPAISGDGVYYDLKYADEIGMEKTPFKKIFSEKIKSDMLSEEARILYVALTRAIERLIITGSVGDIGRFLEKNTEVDIAGFSGADSALKWLTPILLDQNGENKTGVGFDVDLVCKDKLRAMMALRPPRRAASRPPPLAGEEFGETAEVSEYTEKLRGMYDFEYRGGFWAKAPAKVLVTKLKPGLLTENEYTAQALKEQEMEPLPRFLEETAENVPALSGTAAHLFMQFADFEFADVFGAQQEAENLLSRNFLDEAQFSRIKFYPIDRFFESELYAKIKAAKSVYRETPFNLKVPVGEFLDNGAESTEYILIQGAIDLFFEDKNGRVYVVDFKTDQVSGPDGEQVLIRRHKNQINYYCKAVKEILNKPVYGAYIYSFALNRAVEVRI